MDHKLFLKPSPEVGEEISTVVENYDIGSYTGGKRLFGGIMNTTWRIRTDDDETEGKFVLQKLNQMMGKKSMKDYQAVQQYLASHDFVTPRLLDAKDGNSYVEKDGRLWRMFEYIQHDYVDVADEGIAYKSGVALGKLHRLLADFNYNPHFKIEGFHDTWQIMSDLVSAFKDDSHVNKSALVQDEFDFITAHIYRHCLSKDVPKSLVHGDPKINNILFSQNDVVGMIDFDYMMVTSPLVDLGDALRSWSLTKPFGYDATRFNAGLEGYCSENCFYDVKTAKNAMGLITLELAARFLTDYFQTEHFKWDDINYDSAEEHNLERAQNYILYYKNFMGSL